MGIALFGLFGTWAQSGTNFPILSEIVPATARTKAMAWEMALENSFANAVGPPIVAFLATANGYDFNSQDESVRQISWASSSVNLNSANALGKATAACIIAPWLLCLVAYSFLHWTYREDVNQLKKAALQEKSKTKLRRLKERKPSATAGLDSGGLLSAAPLDRADMQLEAETASGV